MNLKTFGKQLNILRIEKEYSLRDVCKLVNYDPSNWSKIERGLIAPPSDINVLRNWARILGIKDEKEIVGFIDNANVAQGIIPEDILAGNMVEHLPAFFRTIRNKKINKDEIDQLIDLLRRS